MLAALVAPNVFQHVGTARSQIELLGAGLDAYLLDNRRYPTTENPDLGVTEIWEICIATGDAHPVHLHLVNFEVLGRNEFTADVVAQGLVQHTGAVGEGFQLEEIDVGDPVGRPAGYFECAPKDMVTALPGQITRIKATFDKSGRYVWHCHILSHEDHEMMRVLHVGPGA